MRVLRHMVCTAIRWWPNEQITGSSLLGTLLAPNQQMQTRRGPKPQLVWPISDRVDLIVRAALSALNCSAALDAGDLTAATDNLGDLREAVARLEKHGAGDRPDVSTLRTQEARLSERLFSGRFAPPPEASSTSSSVPDETPCDAPSGEHAADAEHES